MNDRPTPHNFLIVNCSLKIKRPTIVTSTSLIISHNKFITVNDSNCNDFKNIQGCILYTIVGIIIHSIFLMEPMLINFSKLRTSTSMAAMDPPKSNGACIL